MYLPGTILMWTALLAGLVSTITYWLSIREPERWRGPPIARGSPASLTSSGPSTENNIFQLSLRIGGRPLCLQPLALSPGLLRRYELPERRAREVPDPPFSLQSSVCVGPGGLRQLEFTVGHRQNFERDG